MSHPFQKIINLRITSLIIQETGTFNQQYLRPYETNVEASTMQILTDRFASNVRKQKVYGAEMADVVGSILRPQATVEGESYIANGWNQKRLRFSMQATGEYVTGGLCNYFIFGYTDHPGVSYSGHLDPRMEFYVNSVITTRQSFQTSATGLGSVFLPVDASHIHNDQQEFSAFSQSHKKRLIRPVDVFQGIEANFVLEETPYANAPTYDTRNTLLGTALTSNRNNAIPSSFAARVIEGQLRAMPVAANSSSRSDLPQAAAGMLQEDPVSHNPFLKAITEIRQDNRTSNQFTYGDIMQIDPNVDFVTKLIKLEGGLSQVHSAGQTADWSASNSTTAAAATLAHAVPALMVSCGLTTISLTSTNDVIGGMITTAVSSANSINSGEIAPMVMAFVSRFDTELINSITYTNNLSYFLNMAVDVFGETRISIAIGTPEQYDYAVPSFCDSLFSPVLTSNSERVASVSSDFGMIVSSIQEAMGDAMGTTYNQSVLATI